MSSVLAGGPLKWPPPEIFQPAGMLPTFWSSPDRLAPFISQISTVPASDSHSTSLRPSWLKSPVATTCHSGPILPFEMAELASVVPFMVQIVAAPELPHRMSDLPSPLKSPMPATCHPELIWPAGTP